MKVIDLRTEFITLGQLLKFTKVISSGAEVKFFLEVNDVFVNGTLEKRRGRKLYNGDTISIGNISFVIRKE